MTPPQGFFRTIKNQGRGGGGLPQNPLPPSPPCSKEALPPPPPPELSNPTFDFADLPQ